MIRVLLDDHKQLERAARIYRTNHDAARALGVSLSSFGRACRHHGIETPHLRREREALEKARR